MREYRYCVDGEKKRRRRKTEDRIKWRSQRGGGIEGKGKTRRDKENKMRGREDGKVKEK